MTREEHISLLGKRLSDESAPSHFAAATSKHDDDDIQELNESIILGQHN